MWTTGRQALLGNAGPFILAQWGTLDFKDSADIVLRPKGPSPRFHRWYTDAYSLWTGSKVKDQAWEFLFTLGPARMTGAVQAIINPIAIK